jgi:hypothetical protein
VGRDRWTCFGGGACTWVQPAGNPEEVEVSPPPPPPHPAIRSTASVAATAVRASIKAPKATRACLP